MIKCVGAVKSLQLPKLRYQQSRTPSICVLATKQGAAMKKRWHYTGLSFFDAFASQQDHEREPYPTATLNKQADMLDALGEEGWEVYDIKFDDDGRAVYFLRLELDG